MKRFILSIGILMLLLGIAPIAAHAQEATDEGWKFTAGSVLWLPGLDTKIDTQSEHIDGEATLSDLLPKLQGAFTGEATARYQKFSFAIESTNFALQDDLSVPSGGQRGVEVHMNWLQATVGYRIYETPFLENGKVALEPMIGHRQYWNRFIVDEVGGGETIDKNPNWGDLIIGGRLIANLNEKFALNFSGTYGGFDMGNSSEYSWSFTETGDWNFAPNKTLRVGYMWLGIKKEKGNPSDANYLATNLTLSGPMASLIWHF